MFDETAYVVGEFKTTLQKLQVKKIAIYGIGLKTKAILNQVKSDKITGLLDAAHEGEERWGFPILSLQEAEKMGVEGIIVIADPANFKEIYRRIRDFTQEKQIQVYDYSGNRLSDMNQDYLSSHPYFEVNSDQVRNIIDDYDIISFDIFDTIIMRKVLFPSDVFEIMEKKIDKKQYPLSFFIERTAAETSLLKAGKVPNIYEIYEVIKKHTGMDEDTISYFIELELNVEKKVLTQRKDMVAVFDYAVKNGKRVYLISDMYLPKEMITGILSDLGISGYQDIFVSCDYRTGKEQGLFDIFKTQVNADKYLHIGDNEYADVLAAQKHGIDAFRILSSKQMLGISAFKHLLTYVDSIINRIIIGLFISDVFNSPFSLYHSNGRPPINSDNSVGYSFVGPLSTCFINWMVQKVRQDKCNYIIFSARDGYLFHQLYQLMKEFQKPEDLPPSCYMLISRKVGYQSDLDEEDLKEISNRRYLGTWEELLKDRFDLTEDQIFTSEESGAKSLLEYILIHQKEIKEASDEIRKGLKAYIKNLGLNDYHKIAFMDFVSAGTSQCGLSSVIDSELLGYYFIRTFKGNKKKESLKIESLYKEEGTYHKRYHLKSYYIFLETIYTSLNPSLKGYDGMGNPLFYADKRTEEEKTFVINVQKGITEYFKDYMNIARDLETETKDLELCDSILGCLSRETCQLPDTFLQKLSLYDDYEKRFLPISNII